MTALTYIQAQRKTLAYAERFARILDSIDVLLSPTLPVVAPLIDQQEVKIGPWREDVRLSLLSRTRPANLCGFPAMSVPCGFSSEGLPVGLHLMARRNDEATLLRAAYAYERATPWHLEFPRLDGDGDRA
jgi:aspartyl-tRNA(Asn)/glutamyl-tRNA(Gln) amidotransferase subunit A